MRTAERLPTLEAAAGPEAGRFARIVPLAFVTYSLAFVDRVNYGFGAAAGMAASLGLTERISALLGATFFAGYLLFQIPCTAYAARHSARRVIFWALILWGTFSSLTGLIGNLPLLFVDRFCLGIAEGVVMPSMLVFLTRWFSRAERSRANSFLILGNPATLLWASVVSGFLVQKLGWRMMFAVEGLPSVAWAFVWWRLARDQPREAAWVTAAEADRLARRLEGEQAGLSPAKHYLEAFRSAPVQLLCAQLFFWSIGFYGFALWLPKMIRDASSYSLGIAGLLSGAPYLLGVLLMLAASFGSDRTQRRKPFVWPFLLVGSAAFAGSYLFGAAHFTAAYGCCVVAGGCIFAGYGPFFAIVPDLVPRNVVGESLALINSSGAVGGFLGTYLVGWLNAASGSTSASFICMSGSLALAAACMLPLRAR